MTMLGIYCRTSKFREEKYTLETQKAGGIKCANQLGLDYYIYTDDGISGTKDENSRAGLAMLFSDMKKGRISAVFCMDQQRIQRDEDIWTVFSLLCINHEINYYQGGNLIDLEDPALRMSGKITAIFDKFYTEQTSIKVKDANARKAAIAKRVAEYKCEFNPKHFTFKSSNERHSYVEAHHLIPMSMQIKFY
jgi:DNA invertase Pin-like site-specific DNA recombinase